PDKRNSKALASIARGIPDQANCVQIDKPLTHKALAHRGPSRRRLLLRGHSLQIVGRRKSLHVRNAPKATVGREGSSVAMGQCTKSLRDSGEVEARRERYPHGRDRG